MATAVTTPPASKPEVGTRLKALEDKFGQVLELLEKGNRPHSSAALPQGVFAEIHRRGDDAWPTEKLEKIAKSYNHDNAMRELLNPNRKQKIIGWGPYLRKMAALHEPRTGIALPTNYGREQFEKESGFTNLERAREEGIKQLNGEIRKTALAENSGLTGGYIIPPQFQNELMAIAGEQEFIRPRAKVIPMNSRTMQIPMLDITSVPSSGVSPYFGGVVAQWQPEAASINESEPQFKQSEWTAWDLVFYSVSSNQMLADNGIGLDALLTQLFGAAIPWYQEYAFLQGKGAGSSMPLGVLNAPASIQVPRTTPGAFKLADAAKMMAHCQILSWETACWIMHQSVLPQMIQMVDNSTSNRLVWMNPVLPGQTGPAANKLPQMFLNGLPIFWTEKLPQLGTTGDVMLVDWSRYIIGDRLDLQIDVSPHYLFRNNQLAWRIVCRLDGRPWLNSFITDQAGWQISPFIILQ